MVKKKLKNLLLWNQKADDLESWYVASGARVLPSCSNDDPGLTLTYFMARSNSVPYALYGKMVKQWIFQKLLSSMMSKLEDAVNIKGQGHSLTLVQGHSYSTFSSFFSLEIARLMKSNFVWRLHGIGNESEYTNGRHAHIYMVKTLKNLLWNKKADNLESLYVASDARVVPNLFK